MKAGNWCSQSRRAKIKVSSTHCSLPACFLADLPPPSEPGARTQPAPPVPDQSIGVAAFAQGSNSLSPTPVRSEGSPLTKACKPAPERGTPHTLTEATHPAGLPAPIPGLLLRGIQPGGTVCLCPVRLVMTSICPGPEETGWQQRLDREAEWPQQNFKGLFSKQGNLLRESGDGDAFAITIRVAGVCPVLLWNPGF